MTLKLGLVFCFLLPAVAYADHVTTQSGIVDGYQTPDGQVEVFKGIPYAQPPIGDLRWRDPRPMQPWKGVKDAREFAPICEQPVPAPGNSLATAIFFTPSAPMSENCLYLNVWTSSKTTKKPVMVWIPGGGFRAGSSEGLAFDGAEFARKGVVFVSFNYRVYKFGFLAHPDLTAESPHRSSGNYGLLDQIAALKWIQANIENFGGDPHNVTIFGQSAGSDSTSYLQTSQIARNLFHRVIGESGSGFAPDDRRVGLGFPLLSLKEAEAQGMRLAAALHTDNIRQLRQMSTAQVMSVPSLSRFESSWPILDNYVLTAPPAEVFAEGRQVDVPALVGSNADEGTIFPVAHSLSAFRKDLQARFGERADSVLNKYPADDDKSARLASEQLKRDSLSGWPTWEWANAQARHGKAPVYYYYFSRATAVPPNRRYSENLGADIGAYHGAEIPYVFHIFYPSDFVWTAAEVEYSSLMSDYWVNFARYGNPNREGLPAWPVFDREKKAQIFGDKVFSAPAPNEERYRFWDEFISTGPRR